MKKSIFLSFLLLCAISLSSFAQETNDADLLKSESPVWAEWSMTIGRTMTPILIDENMNTYPKGLFNEGFNALKMYRLPKSMFSLGWFLSFHIMDYTEELDGNKYTILPFRTAIGPAVAIRTPVKENAVTYLTLRTGVKWDYQNRNLPVGYNYCQKAWSPVSSLSLSYAGRLNKDFLEGIGVKASVYAYGKAKGIKSESPPIYNWELGVCFYYSSKRK